MAPKVQAAKEEDADNATDSELGSSSPPPPPEPLEGADRGRSRRKRSSGINPESASNRNSTVTEPVVEPEAGKSTDDSKAGRNAYERRLWASVLEAAGGGSGLSLEDAKAGLKVVSIGRYDSSEGRACACGQKPLQRVFHLRHEGTGKQLDIGKSCATRFNVLGTLETQEAERALRNLEQLVENPESEMEADLRKFARSNGLLVEEESEMIKEGRHMHRIAELKAISVAGLNYVHLTSEEISDSLQTQNVVPSAARQALVRLAILAERRRLLNILDVNTLEDKDMDLGKGGQAEKPRQSLVAEAVKRGFKEEAHLLLDAVGWSGPHARVAFHQSLISMQDDFSEKYLSRQDAAPPDLVAARLAVQSYKSLKGVQAIICWCLCSGGAAAQAVLDEALREACRVAPENFIVQLLEAGAKAHDSLALLRWCARLGGSGSNQAAEVQDSSSGVRVAEALISQGQARLCFAGRQLERGCFHFAAASGDAPLVELLMCHGACPWECTFVDSMRSCPELKRGGIQQSERQLPLEVAISSEKNTTKVEQILRTRMTDDLDLACQTIFDPQPGWLEENLESIRCRLNHGDCNHKVLSMFGKHVDMLRRDPARARSEAFERRKQEEDRKRREEEERLAREQAQAEQEEQRRLQREEAQRKREALERKLAEEEARRKEELRRAEAEARQRRAEERRANLTIILRDGEQKIISGTDAGLTFEEVARRKPFFLRHVVEGSCPEGQAPPSEAFMHFAKIRFRFLEAEICHAKKNIEAGLDLLHGENMKKEAEWASVRSAEDEAWRVEKKGLRFKDAFDLILRCQDWTLNGKGKYAGKTFESTFRADQEYADWWLRKGPGSNTSFGRFAQARMQVSTSDIRAEEKRRAEQDANEGNQQPDMANRRSSDQAAFSNKSSLHASCSEQDGLDRSTALATAASQSQQSFLKGKHQGLTYLQVVSTDPDYADWWLDKGPGKDNSFGRFADSWRCHGFSTEEIEAAQLAHQKSAQCPPEPPAKRSQAEIGSGSLSEPPVARIRIQSPSPDRTAKKTSNDEQRYSAMHSSPQIRYPAETLMATRAQSGSPSSYTFQGVKAMGEKVCPGDWQEVIENLLSQGNQNFSQGKYQGLTYLHVARSHPDYLDWWLDKGPGKETNFGRFADGWRSCQLSREEVDAAQQGLQSTSEQAESIPSATGAMADVNELPAKRHKKESPLLPSVAASIDGKPDIPGKLDAVIDHQGTCRPSSVGAPSCDAMCEADSSDDETALLAACAALDEKMAAERFKTSSEASAAGLHLQPWQRAMSSMTVDDAPEGAAAAGRATLKLDMSTSRPAVFPSQSSTTDLSMPHPCALDRGPVIVKFGKHQGRSYEEVFRSEPGWCSWARSQADPSPALRDFVEYLVAVQP